MNKTSFNTGWTFKKQGDGKGIDVVIPHDAMLHEGRAQENPSGASGAYFAGGCYTYENEFQAPLAWKEKRMVLQFEGIYQTAKIYINDKEAGNVFYGYTTTEIQMNEFLIYGAMNVIRVEVDNQNQPNSRWYSGAGIYRSVWLYELEADGLDLYDILIRTISYEPAQIEVDVLCENNGAVITILDGEKELAKKSGNHITFEIPNAQLWSDSNPYLYQCKVELEDNGKVIDTYTEKFGIRLLEWSPKGFFVNGQETLLRGGCLHHDNGLLGACAFEDAEWRKVKIMKENGFNAIRSSHNVCSRAMLEACDALGMYVMDETWDMWYRHKSKYDYADQFYEHYKEDLKGMINKDYNHPSVIFYSVGNEISEPASEEGQKVEKDIVAYVHSLDRTRPVTAGFNLMIIANAAKGQEMYDGEGGLNAESASNDSQKMDMSKMDSAMFNQMTQQIGMGMNHSADSDEADQAVTPAIDNLDITGYNYASGRYPLEGEKHPERIIFGSETFPQDIYHNWEMVKKYPYLLGDFMWAAWDYLGEAGIGVWSDSPDATGFNNPYPWILGGAGVIDVLGNPDGEAFYAKTVWNLSEQPLIAVRPVTMIDNKTMKSVWRGTNAIPSWSWKDCDGKQAFIEVYARGQWAELKINDVVKEKRALEEYKTIFETTYEPGIVEVVIYDENNNETGKANLISTDEKLFVRVKTESEAIRGRLAYINIDICGENGIVESNADTTMEVEVEGGTLLAYGSANPRTEESFLTGRYTTYYGRSQAVVLVGNEKELSIKVHSSMGDLKKIFPIKEK